MLNPDRFTEDDRTAVLTAMAEEVALQQAGRPYSEAVIVACDMVLRANPYDREPPRYWWNE